tara:strand:+ start:1638 stop:2771 length:1134 start_codon:yes stop_codon:yes gene_type:complete
MFPLLTAALSCLVYLGKVNVPSTSVLSPAFCIALTLALLNSQKVAEGDLIAYLNYFKELEGLSLIEVSLLYINEPIFYLLAWVFGHIFSFSDFTFKFCFSFVGYFSLLFATGKIMIGIGFSRKQIILGSLIVALSTTVFANSLHLIRQFVSLSFLTLALSSRTSAWKYLGFLLAFLTHISSGVLIAFYFIASANNITKLLLFLGLIFTEKLLSIIIFLANLTGLNPLLYLAVRVSSETFHDMPGLSSTALLFLVVTLVFLGRLFVIKRNYCAQDGRQNVPLLPKAMYEMNIYTGISVLVLQLVLGLYEPAARLMFSYIILTMISIASSLYFLRIDSLFLGLGGAILMINFSFGLVYGTWNYSNLEQTLGCFLICRNL